MTSLVKEALMWVLRVDGCRGQRVHTHLISNMPFTCTEFSQHIYHHGSHPYNAISLWYHITFKLQHHEPLTTNNLSPVYHLTYHNKQLITRIPPNISDVTFISPNICIKHIHNHTHMRYFTYVTSPYLRVTSKSIHNMWHLCHTHDTRITLI